MKEYFKLNQPYHFELNDIVAPANILNTILVIRFGLIASWFGLLVTAVCVIDDIIEVRRLNLISLHTSILILNTYFLLVYYGIL